MDTLFSTPEMGRRYGLSRQVCHAAGKSTQTGGIKKFRGVDVQFIKREVDGKLFWEVSDDARAATQETPIATVPAPIVNIAAPIERSGFDRIREALQFLPTGGHDERVRVAFMVKSEFGDAGRDLWDTWRDGRGDDEADSVWRSTSETGPLTIGTLIFEAKAAGWHDEGQYQRPSPEQIAERQRLVAERAAEKEAKDAKQRITTAQAATAIWKAATEAKADNPYLARKGVLPTETLREIDVDAAAAILGYAPKCDRGLLAGRLLVVPAKQGDRLSTVELIDGEGRKAALAGKGTKTGAYWAAQPLPEGDGQEPLQFFEGVATTLSGKEATGDMSIATLSSGNMLAVAKVMRIRYPTRPFVFGADLVKATGEPDPHAIEAARAIGGKLAIPDFGADREPGDTDFNDMARIFGKEAVRQAIAGAQEPCKAERQASEGNAPASELPLSDAQRIDSLAKLSPLEYDRMREAEAKALGIRAATLDKMVKEIRQEKSDTDGMDFDEVEPWPDPVEPALLLSELADTVKRFIVCPEETAHASALWIAMTWFMDVVQIAPLAVITAPEKRCGKSQLLFLLGRLVCRPLAASNISPAALFRSVDAWKPTLLVDEADAFMRDNEELRGLLNCGHTRDSAYIVRVVGDDHTPKRFNVWGAKALAGIGHLADTLMDRSIILELRRKLPHENVLRLRYAEPGLFDTLVSKLARFADDYREPLRRSRPSLPPSLHDRAQDNWEPLLAIAEVSGGNWPSIARKAALKLSGSDADGGTVGNELLADIREIFEAKKLLKISTADLIELLCGDDEKSWATYNRGKPISPRQVAKKLKDYGIASKNLYASIQFSV